MIKLFWQQIPNIAITDIVSDFTETIDGVVFDTEHGSWNNETLQNCLLCSTGKMRTYVRMKENSQLAQTAVDNGCTGLIISNVEKKINLNIGTGFCSRNKWGDWLDVEINPHCYDYKMVAQIEGLGGIDFLKKYSLGYDYYMIGPYDLSNDLGCVGDFKNPEYIKAIKQFEKLVPPKKRAVHIVKDIESQIEKYKDYGMVAFSLDTLAIVDKIKDIERIAGKYV